MADQREASETAAPASTRLIIMSSAALADGFRLIGFETYPDATQETLESVLEQLVLGQEKAFLLLEHDLARSNGPWLKRVRNEGGYIVVTEIPPLGSPGDYHPPVEDLVQAILGPSALEG